VKEICKDIFEWIEENRKDNIIILVHCISADFALGAGIAKAVNIKFGEKESLKRAYPIRPTWDGHGFGLITGHPTIEEVSVHVHVCNLVTKEFYWEKPTYTTLQESLDYVKNLIFCLASRAKQNNFGFKIVMPKIGCGLDKLDWTKVREMVLSWAGTDFDVTVCHLNNVKEGRKEFCNGTDI